MSPRTKPKSVSLAAGYATSISLYPHLIICWKKRVFWGMVIGLARAWFPSRRSVDSQTGGSVMRLLGHVRSGRSIDTKGLYFLEGSGLHAEFERRTDRAKVVKSYAQHRHDGLRVTEVDVALSFMRGE